MVISPSTSEVVYAFMEKVRGHTPLPTNSCSMLLRAGGLSTARSSADAPP